MSEPSDFAPCATRPVPLGRRRGQAVGVELRRESAYANTNAHTELTVLAFRLMTSPDAAPLDVVLRGRSLLGTVRDGDWIELDAEPDRFGRYDLTRIDNLTTSSVVVATGRPARGPARAAVAVIALVVIVCLLVLMGVLFGLAAG